MQNFLEMGGYALYVWGSFAAAAAICGWNVWAPRSERRHLIESLEDEE